ncbi:Abi family protein [Dyadobacter fermentans]|uniref:Abi family protein n=1 Tax=Dyadobacter fermentans TaxID=94254 RepID=UPI001CBBC003|nr:Abi family protein [Dyadobacter fermentans]MBZ1360112.1 Abi family protein [Dyadobacter fermentans]
MLKTHYSKPALSFQRQIQQLKARGLVIQNPQKALHLLQSISYYRLSGYWYPLLANKEKHLFKPGAQFENCFKLYRFDRELRSTITSELEKIEIAVRAKIIYNLSEQAGPFGYLSPAIYKKPQQFHDYLHPKLNEEYARSDEEFIRAFRIKYANPLPPSWMAMEIVSFGTLSRLFSYLKPGREKRGIANHFGLSESVFENWLHCMVYLRNICAHHSRLWNRTLSIQPQLPLSPKRIFIQNKNVRSDRAYFVLVMIRYMLQTVNPKSDFVQKIKALLIKYSNVDPQAMGFPSNWEQEPFWQQ